MDFVHFSMAPNIDEIRVIKKIGISQREKGAWLK